MPGCSRVALLLFANSLCFGSATVESSTDFEVEVGVLLGSELEVEASALVGSGDSADCFAATAGDGSTVSERSVLLL